ncbi:hypothetical protein [Brevibacillus sp. NRS-1366]|uniref:hypothetical protein n=1 Tax=Brevibacillus sp. NRS-1366 TaxID=3233899 RepID=UPI003D24BAD8
MDWIDGLEALGSVIKKSVQLTGRVLLASGELLTTLFEFFWNRWEQKRMRQPKAPAGPLGKQ